MGWLKSASASLWGVVSISQKPGEAELAGRTEDIRLAMLSMLGESSASAYSALRRRLMFAADVEALWYLRSEWMAVVSQLHGERTAANHLSHINRQFDGLVTKGMTSRPSPLSSIK